MKQNKITTSKGEFLVVDATTLDKVSGQALVDEYGDYIILSEITEEQASSVMSKKDIAKYQGKMCSLNSVFGLNRFLKSKGITDLSNKYIFKL